MPTFASPVIRVTFGTAAGILPGATALTMWIAGIPALAMVACVISSAIIAIGPVMVLLVDQWQRARIIKSVLGKIDNADDAAKLLQALAPVPAVDTANSGSPQKP